MYLVTLFVNPNSPTFTCSDLSIKTQESELCCTIT